MMRIDDGSAAAAGDEGGRGRGSREEGVDWKRGK